MPYANLFHEISSHLETIITHGGYPFIFLTALLEGLPLIGTAVPGHVAIIFGGFLARIGILNLWWVMGLAVAAAVLGDYVGFVLGRRYGMTLIARLRRYFFITDSHIERAKRLLEKHTGKAMIIGRFSPVTRALMPFLVGTGTTPHARFWLFNIVGGVAWAVVSVMIGYLFGAGYHAVAGYLGRFVVVALIAAAVIIWGYRFVNVRFHIFRKYELFTLALNLISLWALARTVQDAWSASSFMANFDVTANLFMAQHAVPFTISAASWITTVGSVTSVSLVGAFVSVWLLVRHKWRSAAIMILSLGSTGLCLGIMKEFFMRVRPENAVYALTDPSFPSGHAAMAAAFLITAGYLLSPHIRSWVWRELYLAACVIITFAVGFSRIVLNVHWVSDVVAGWSLGIFLATASILSVRYVSVLIKNKGMQASNGINAQGTL